MENIKHQLLESLDDLATHFDHHNSSDQHIEIEAKVNDNKGNIYHLVVELTALTKSVYIEGEYHSQFKQSEPSHYIYEIEDIRIEHVYLFKNDSEADITFNENEIYNYLKSKL